MSNISLNTPSTTCVCPKCGTKHKRKLLWIGRGTPRKFCRKCEKLSVDLADITTEIFYDWRT